MKKTKTLAGVLLAALCSFCSCACSGGNDEINEPQEPTIDPVDTTVVTSFVKGADVGWLTEMEADGMKFYNAAGVETECLSLLQQCGINAVRLRVWVNPEKEYCNYNNLPDVLAKARRAHAQGMDIMIDFHYSDWFADPSHQDKPAAWADKTFEELKTAVADHTTEILAALKAENITPRWVQVGNETRNGMLWPSGQLWDNSGDLPNGWKNYVALHNAGYDAVKSVFPEALVITHIDNAWDNQDWWFKKFRATGGKMDMIGLSHYPQTHDTKSATEMNDLALTHIAQWGKTYAVPVMVCEVGVKVYYEEEAASVLTDFITRLKQVEQCVGVFYWEPQVYNSWKPAKYTDLGWNAYDMGAFTAAGKPSKVMKAFE